MKRQFYLLLLSGLWPFIQGISHGYVVIQQQKTWNDAQAYCRQNHIDLPTFQRDEVNLREAFNTSLNSLAWTGLYRYNNSWWWTYRNTERIIFTFWKSGEPNNLDGRQECAVTTASGWDDVQCGGMFPFFCFNASVAERFVLISHINKSWFGALAYCMQYHTDLAYVWNQTESDQLQQMLQGFDKAWIGLFWDTYRWSDNTRYNMFQASWMTGQPNQTGLEQPCGAANPSGLMDDRLCTDALPFICLTRTQKNTVRLEVKSSQNVNEPVVMDTILQWLKRKLKDRGIEKDLELTWKQQPSGNVFSLKRVENLNKISCSDNPS